MQKTIIVNGIVTDVVELSDDTIIVDAGTKLPTEKIKNIKTGKLEDVFTKEASRYWHKPSGVTIGPEGGGIGDAYDGLKYVRQPEPVINIPDAEIAKSELAQLDKKMSRALEDVIDLMVSKNIFAVSELPQQTQDNLSSKKNARIRVRK